jgi:hypothetical protein
MFYIYLSGGQDFVTLGHEPWTFSCETREVLHNGGWELCFSAEEELETYSEGVSPGIEPGYIVLPGHKNNVYNLVKAYCYYVGKKISRFAPGQLDDPSQVSS